MPDGSRLRNHSSALFSLTPSADISLFQRLNSFSFASVAKVAHFSSTIRNTWMMFTVSFDLGAMMMRFEFSKCSAFSVELHNFSRPLSNQPSTLKL